MFSLNVRFAGQQNSVELHISLQSPDSPERDLLPAYGMHLVLCRIQLTTSFLASHDLRRKIRLFIEISLRSRRMRHSVFTRAALSIRAIMHSA